MFMHEWFCNRYSVRAALRLLCIAGVGATTLSYVAAAQLRKEVLTPAKMPKIATIDERFQSYNVEAIEVTGGRFWKPYDSTVAPKDSKGADTAPMIGSLTADLFVQRPPIDLGNHRLQSLAKALGPAYLRMSGSWQNATYFQDTESASPSAPPAGFNGVMTRPQLRSVVDFAKNVDADLLTSFAVSMGTRDEKGVWTSEQATRVNDYIHSVGGKISATEFMNEPTLATMSGVPKGYGPKEYARDVEIFHAWLKRNSPQTIFVGAGGEGEGMGWHQPSSMHRIPSEELLKADGKPVYDAYSFHFYSAISERCSKMLGGGVTQAEALLPPWFAIPDKVYKFYAALRDKYEPGKPIWVTETGEAACGGDRFAATYLDTFRYLNELGALAKHGVKVVAHNTLAETDYALIDAETFTPRPDYWAALLWRRLMGTTVLDAGAVNMKNLYVYAHCSRGVPGGVTVLAINPGNDSVVLSGGGPVQIFQLTAKEVLSKEVLLNGQPLELSDLDGLPQLSPINSAKPVAITPRSIAFLVFPKAANQGCQNAGSYETN